MKSLRDCVSLIDTDSIRWTMDVNQKNEISHSINSILPHDGWLAPND